MENTELVKRCQAGEVESFAKLYNKYAKKALGTAYLISSHKGIAEDIVQEAFIYCFQQIKSLKTPEAFEVWFYKIIVRTGWKMLNKQKQLIPVDTHEMERLNSESFVDTDMNNSVANITLCDALEKLSMPLKSVVILHYFNDLTIKEIAKVLGCFQGTVKSRLHNARKQLFHELYGETDGCDGKETELRYMFK